MNQQVICKKRVADHGEVFTHQREVDAMLDLVKHQTEIIDSKFLEPACGNGNFLAEILNRKLKVVQRRYGKHLYKYQPYSILAVGSVYGIDILEDNVVECRRRLAAIVERNCPRLFPDDYTRTVEFILQRNIIWGDALSLCTAGDNARPIVFSEWSLVNDTMMQRRDFTFHELLSHGHTRQTPLFSDLGEDVFLPEPVKSFPLTHYLKLADAEGK